MAQIPMSKWQFFFISPSDMTRLAPINFKNTVFGVTGNTMSFRIEASGLHNVVLAELNLEKRGVVSNLIAELLKGNHNWTIKEGTIIKGLITHSRLRPGWWMEKLVRFVGENKVVLTLSTKDDFQVSAALCTAHQFRILNKKC